MEWLKQVGKYHTDYIETVKRYGGCYYSEDIVQEMYLKLHDYNHKDKVYINGVVNRPYVWFVLRSVFIDYTRKKKHIIKVGIGEGFDIVDEVKTDEMNYEEAYGLILEQIDAEVDTWHHYDKNLFKLYSRSTMSMRDINEKTNISTMSIFTTIKNCKQRLKDNVGEHYKYFIIGDYEKL
jgi:DNA-directed RNA polymerase specialized sigma24 family protein